jgi:hypothetical protein
VTRRFKIACSAKKLFGKGVVVEFFISIEKVSEFLNSLHKQSSKSKKRGKELRT